MPPQISPLPKFAIFAPDSWLKLAYSAGMRYSVFVAKHHDGQVNELATAVVKASAIKENNVEKYGSAGLFDNLGETAWETPKTDTLCALEFDLGKSTTLTALSLAEKGQIEGWNHGCDIRFNQASPHPQTPSLFPISFAAVFKD